MRRRLRNCSSGRGQNGRSPAFALSPFDVTIGCRAVQRAESNGGGRSSVRPFPIIQDLRPMEAHRRGAPRRARGGSLFGVLRSASGRLVPALRHQGDVLDREGRVTSHFRWSKRGAKALAPKSSRLASNVPYMFHVWPTFRFARQGSLPSIMRAQKSAARAVAIR